MQVADAMIARTRFQGRMKAMVAEILRRVTTRAERG
jgi:hypothetical protein